MSIELGGLERILRTCARQLAVVTGRPVDGVIGAQRIDEGWIVEAELIHRKAVPDSMDLLGRYRVTTDPHGNLLGFERIGLRKRGDPSPAGEEAPE